ncbi:uncharacterized protein LOC128263979 [Drosophila gunungcola]|uniref:uncharacterized protein LOC128263979 n=1 Tax=Drosophila gunungcola TaxID=103775 RepID=UPI0022E363DD|nr:uncharacterized protein LOC128263979 [Drosophila gunungcola]
MNNFTEQFLNGNETESEETTNSTNTVDMSNVSYTNVSFTSNFEYPSTSTMLQLIFNQMQTLNTNVEDLKERLIKLETENTKIQTRLLTEVKAQRKLVQVNKIRMLLPPKPFDKLEDLTKFEEDLNNSAELCEQLETEMINYNNVEKMFTDEIATKYSWKGTNTKICVLSLAITTTVRSAFNEKMFYRREAILINMQQMVPNCQ